MLASTNISREVRREIGEIGENGAKGKGVGARGNEKRRPGYGVQQYSKLVSMFYTEKLF
jgi:hypothetical protein